MTHRQWLTSFIKTHTDTRSLSLSLSPSSLSLFPLPLPVACLRNSKKCSVVFFSFFFPLSLSLVLSCPYLQHFLRRIPLPVPISPIYLFLSFHLQISSPLSLSLCLSIADVLKSPLFHVYQHISCNHHLECYFYLSFLFLVQAGVLCCSVVRGEMSHKVCFCLCYSIGTAVLGYTCHIPPIIANTHSKHLFSPIFLSLLFSPLALFFRSPFWDSSLLFPLPPTHLLLFFSLLLSLSRVKERVRSEKRIGAGERCCPDQKGPLKLLHRNSKHTHTHTRRHLDRHMLEGWRVVNGVNTKHAHWCTNTRRPSHSKTCYFNKPKYAKKTLSSIEIHSNMLKHTHTLTHALMRIEQASLETLSQVQ